ncbi:hypothetical protein KY290_034179 [Solanum tuberosum]|uniref:GYF domain-containing protein n=1 Tax=Solanum tuberosum TaxID=4113 RepID=A0ABQ7U491_SOLTU|nr:hypothetical protein KY289_033571 [Solanum tuberosum]KAH0741136.1 hypothetical protein KY290_034179 [Solanum tuberosum]
MYQKLLLAKSGSPLCVEMSCQSNGESEKVSSPRDWSILVYPQASASDRVVWCTHKLYLQLGGCMSMNRVKWAEHGTHSLNQQMATAGLARTLRVNEESCWLFEDHEGMKPGPHSLVELFLWFHYGYIVDSVMVSLCLLQQFAGSLN